MPERHNHQELVELTHAHFVNEMKSGNPMHEFFPYHVSRVRQLALEILSYHPEADRLVVELAVELHDIGNKNNQHSVHEKLSEAETRTFLPRLGLDAETIEKVAHCVRTHRCKEGAMPETIEAKIVATADSASHLTDIFYIIMLNWGIPRKEILEKIDRDKRDIQTLPEPMLNRLAPLINGWRNLVSVWPEASSEQ